jgi:hypothetical protein
VVVVVKVIAASMMMMMVVVVGDQKPAGVTGGNSGSGSLRGVGATGSGIGGVAV